MNIILLFLINTLRIVNKLWNISYSLYIFVVHNFWQSVRHYANLNIVSLWLADYHLRCPHIKNRSYVSAVVGIWILIKESYSQLVTYDRSLKENFRESTSREQYKPLPFIGFTFIYLKAFARLLGLVITLLLIVEFLSRRVLLSFSN